MFLNGIFMHIATNGLFYTICFIVQLILAISISKKNRKYLLAVPAYVVIDWIRSLYGLSDIEGVIIALVPTNYILFATNVLTLSVYLVGIVTIGMLLNSAFDRIE